MAAKKIYKSIHPYAFHLMGDDNKQIRVCPGDEIELANPRRLVLLGMIEEVVHHVEKPADINQTLTERKPGEGKKSGKKSDKK